MLRVFGCCIRAILSPYPPTPRPEPRAPKQIQHDLRSATEVQLSLLRAQLFGDFVGFLRV